jgi:hypothetical protein
MVLLIYAANNQQRRSEIKVRSGRCSTTTPSNKLKLQRTRLALRILESRLLQQTRDLVIVPINMLFEDLHNDVLAEIIDVRKEFL